MSKYELHLFAIDSSATNLFGRAETLSEAKKKAGLHDRISPGIIHRIEIRKFSWWNRWRGINRFTRYRYSQDQNCFISLSNEAEKYVA
jgi:hypothetical protein